MKVTGANRGVDELSKMGYAGFGDHRWPSGTIGSNRAVVAGEVSALEVAETGGAVSRAGAAYGEKSEMLCGAGEELAIEATADEEGQAVVAEGPYSGEKTAMPEGVDGRRSDIEADGGAGLADVFVAKGGPERKSDCAGDARTYSQKDSLLQCVDGGHVFSLPLSVCLLGCSLPLLCWNPRMKKPERGYSQS